MTIRRRLLFWFLPPVIIIGIITGGIVYYLISRSVKQNIFDQMEIAAGEMLEHVNIFLEAKRGRTIDFSSDGFIRTRTEKINNKTDVESSTFQLNRHLLYNKKSLDEENILEVFVADLDGKVISSTENSQVGHDISGELYFLRTKERGSFISDLHYSPEFKQNTFEVSVLMKVNEGMRPIGIIVSRYRGDTLSRVTRSGIMEELGHVKQRGGLGKTGELYIVNKDKLMITGSRFIEGATLKQVVDTEGVRAAFDNGVGMTGIYPDYRGILIIGVSRYFEKLDCVLLAEKDVSEAFAPIVHLRNVAITIAVVSITTVVIITIFVATGITKPIRKLAEGTKVIAGGDLSYKIKTKSKDEIGNLTASFNDMTYQLEESKKQLQDYALNLEKKVDDKTYEISEKSRELEKVNKELEEFIYIISHDLKEPLFTIEGYTSRLSRNYDDLFDEKGKRYVNRIKANIKVMSEKIYDIMEVLKTGRVDYDYNDIDSGIIVRDVIKMSESRIKDKEINVIIQEGLPTVLCDGKRMRDVFSNLVTNAIKFIDNRNGNYIKIGCDKDEDYYRFFVEDTGIGIREEYQEQIFKMFNRLKDIEAEGTGVGLTIVKMIVELHNGKIWIESPVKDGRGTRFCFTIPANKGDRDICRRKSKRLYL